MSNSWHPLEQYRPLLDVQKFVSIDCKQSSDDAPPGMLDWHLLRDSELGAVIVWYRQQAWKANVGRYTRSVRYMLTMHREACGYSPGLHISLSIAVCGCSWCRACTRHDPGAGRQLAWKTIAQFIVKAEIEPPVTDKGGRIRSILGPRQAVDHHPLSQVHSLALYQSGSCVAYLDVGK